MRIRPLVAAAALTATLAASLVTVVPSAGAATVPAPPRRIVTGWLPYWTPTTSTAVLVANKDLFTDASPFWFSASSATTIAAHQDATSRAAQTAQLHAAGVPVIPTVTDGLPAHAMAAVLASPTTRTQHVVALLGTVMAGGYDGIDLDYEKFAFSDGSSTWASTRPSWVAFVAQLSASLHAHGKRLTVAVPYMTSATAGYWVYDYKGIGPYVDRLRIMTYDYHTSTVGPIAPISWVTKVAAFASTQLPASKVQIGVPTYGYDWPLSTTGCPADNLPKKVSYTAQQAAALAASLTIVPTWDATNGERTFSYHRTYSGHSSTGAAATCTIVRTVWFDDHNAVALRSRLVGQFGLGGIALWTIGGEDPASWAALRAYARTIAPTRTLLTQRVAPASVGYGSPVTVAGLVRNVDGAGLEGVDVQLQTHVVGTNYWTVSATRTTAFDGTVAFSHIPASDTEYRLVAPSTWSLVGTTGLGARVRVQTTGSQMYVTQGIHWVGTQEWQTTCVAYSTGKRCGASIWSSRPVRSGSAVVLRTGWYVHRYTYVDQATAAWSQNWIARPGQYVWNGLGYTVTCTPSATAGPRTCQTWTTQPLLVKSGSGWVTRQNPIMINNVLLSP